MRLHQMEIKIQKIKIEGKLWLRLMKPTEKEKWEVIVTIISLQLTVVDGIKAIFRRIMELKPLTQALWLALESERYDRIMNSFHFAQLLSTTNRQSVEGSEGEKTELYCKL